MTDDKSKRGGRAPGPDTAGGRFKGFRWLDDAAAYGAAAGLLRLGVIPLLAPAERRRRRRWEEILRWYGLAPDGGRAPLPPPPDGEPSGRDVVVGLGDEYGPAAALLAAATARPLLVAPPEDPLRPLREATGAASVVFVGRPAAMRKVSLHAIARSLEVPWGVLTARDLAAMSFVVAKRLADSGLPDEGSLLLDAPAEAVRMVGAVEPDGGYSLTDGESLRGLLSARSFTHMVVHAHGEGAHANLKSAVLCGLPGETESWRGGAVAGGCRQAGSKRVCKRASRQRRHVFSFGDLRARNLYLLSCNGFTTAGELYPSDVSAVLSAAEGYAATVLTTDRSLGIESKLPELALRLSGRGLGPAAVCDALNQLTQFREGMRPFVLCGDPLGSEPPTATPAPGGDVSLTPREPARLIDLKKWSGAAVIGISKDPAGLSLFRGEELGALLSDGGRRRKVRIEDLSARWQALHDRLVTIAGRYQRAGRAASVIKDFWWDKYKAAPAFQEKLGELESVGGRLLTATQRAFRMAEKVRGAGVWDARLELLCRAVEHHVGRWDECFARIVEGHILDCDLPPFFLHESVRVVNNFGESCQRCGAGLTLLEATDALDGRVAAAATDCPTCGPRELWQVGATRFVVRGGPEIHPGRIYSFDLEQRPANEAGGAAGGPEPAAAQVVAQFQDLGGKPFFTQIATPRNGRLRLRAPVPPGCSADMQTLRIAWVQGLAVSAWTLQYACVPAASRRRRLDSSTR